MNYTHEEINLIILSSLKLTYTAKRKLLSNFESSSPDFEKSKNYLIKTLSCGVYNKVKDKFYDNSYRKEVLNSLEKKGIKCVTYFSEAYPETLKNIDRPPVLLYCKGNISLLKTQCFSIVGSRNTLSNYLTACENISGELSKAFTIVSGLAEGADCSALKGALNCGGNVISVLAYGLDHIYPKINASLLKRVENYGLVITEYSPEVKSEAYYFPVRNRIIAGLSRGTLIVSAGKTSGALITANYAVNYNRDVFAFPYGLGVANGEGCNNVLKNGACLTKNALDIFNEYGLSFKGYKKIELSDTEHAVYSLIQNSNAELLTVIADKLDKPISEITTVIMTLIMKGLIVSMGGNRFSAVS